MLITTKWNVAGGLAHFESVMGFHKYVQDYFDVAENFIASVYDSHAGLLWNGGRYTTPFPFSVEESIHRVHAYNDLGIGFNIAFSNRLLDRSALDDEDCNWFLERCESDLNGVIVASDLLREHVRQRFPRYQLIASIGFLRKDLACYRQAQQDYDRVVLHPDLNRDHELIRELDPAKLEVLVNERCVVNCPFRQEHADHISRIILQRRLYFREDSEHTRGGCLAVERGYSHDNGLVLGFDEVDALFELGVRHFKIQGREHAFDLELDRALKRYVLQHTMRRICRRARRLSPRECGPGPAM